MAPSEFLESAGGVFWLFLLRILCFFFFNAPRESELLKLRVHQTLISFFLFFFSRENKTCLVLRELSNPIIFQLYHDVNEKLVRYRIQIENYAFF